MNSKKSTTKTSFKTKLVQFYQCEVKTFYRILGIKK